MNVSLTPELEQLVHLKVKTGRYTSASEVIREALRLLEERDELQVLRKDEIRKKIAEGMASLRAGKGTDGEAFFDNMDADKMDAEHSEPEHSRPV